MQVGLLEIILYNTLYWARRFIRVERGNDVSYFFLISRLQKYWITIFLRDTVWKMFICLFYAFFFRSFSHRCKAISKGLIKVSALLRDVTVHTLETTVFREIRDLILFHVFLILFQFVLKYLYESVRCSSQGWRVNVYFFCS